MNVEKIKEIAVLKNTIMFLRILLIFPSKEDINHPEKNIFMKYTILSIIGTFFPIGIAIHLITNMTSKYVIK